jgi:hypothetical protein
MGKRKQFAEDLMTIVRSMLEVANEEHITKIETDDESKYSRRSFGMDLPKVGWVNVSYTERKPESPSHD